LKALIDFGIIKADKKEIFMKRILSLVTAIIMLCLTASSCNSDVPAASKENIFSAAPLIENGELFDSVLQAVFNNEYFIFTASKIIYPENDDDSYKSVVYLISADRDGKIINTKELITAAEENSYESENYPAFCAAGETVYAIKQHSRLVTNADGYMLPENDTVLVTIDENLAETEVLNISDTFKGITTDMYVQSLAADDSGNVYLYMGQDIYGVNINTGEIVFTKTGSDGGYVSGLMRMADGRVGITEFKNTADSSGLYLTPIEGDKTGESIPLPLTGSVVSGGEGSPYAYYHMSNSFIYGFDENFETKTVTADLLASGIGNINITSVIMSGGDKLFYLSPTEFAVIGSDGDTQNYGIYRLTKRDPKDVPDRKMITVAGLYEDDYIAGFIKKYNESNSLYQVEYKFYTTGLSYDANELVINLNTDLVSGKAPDVLIIDGNLALGSYISKGMFEDLYPFIDKDKELSREDLLESMLHALETDGKLYRICQAFSVSSLVGKTEIFGSVPGISLADMQAAAEKIEGAKLLNSDRMGILYTFLYNSIDNYVDYENRTSSFNSPEFITMLELAMSYPESLESESYYNGMQTVPYSQDKMLLDTVMISDFREAQNYAKAQFDAPVTFLGYPDKSGGSGIIANPRSEAALIKGSENPEGAWDFIKQFIYYKPPYQIGNIIYGNYFSLYNSYNDELAAEALEDPYYIDQNGVKFPTENTVFAGGVQVTMPNNTEADNMVTYDLLNNISGIGRSDINIWNIIMEDIENYFGGKKSAEETAALIDNRVSTYLAESA
jgi:ABC-type glycerol-3-phosphate transport system substrate-binding protein